MQAGPRDHYATDFHRLQVGDRGDGAGTAYLQADGFDHGLRLARRKFEGHRPARRATDLAEFPLQGQIVDLDHHAVDLHGQGIAARLQLPVVTDDPAPPLDHGRSCQVDRQTPALQVLQQGHLTGW